MIKDEMPLLCKVENGVITIAISANVLRFAAERHPDFWDGESDTDTPNIKITDADAFARDVVRAINNEAEDGSTLLTRMLDEVIRQAIEDGCDGVDHNSY